MRYLPPAAVESKVLADSGKSQDEDHIVIKDCPLAGTEEVEKV